MRKTVISVETTKLAENNIFNFRVRPRSVHETLSNALFSANLNSNLSISTQILHSEFSFLFKKIILTMSFVVKISSGNLQLSKKKRIK